MKITKIILLFLISLFLATQVWAWVRILGSFWISDYLTADSVSQLFLSVFLFKMGIEGFLVVIIPAAFLHFMARIELSGWSVVLSYIYLSLVLSIIYLLYLIGFPPTNFNYAINYGPVYLLAGVIGALTFHGVTQLFLLVGHDLVKEESINEQRRRYLFSGSAIVAGGASLLGGLVGPYRVWKHSDDFIDINVSKLKDGQLMRVNVDERPVWLLKRSTLVNNQLQNNVSDLYDPESVNSIQPANMKNLYRSIKPEYFIAYGICTHLGCSPTYRPDGMPEFDKLDLTNRPVFFCPCHAGVFDLAGRVLKGTPPPTNLKVPDYEFISENEVRIYYPSLADVWTNY